MATYTEKPLLGSGLPDPLARELLTGSVSTAKLTALAMTDSVAKVMASLTGDTAKDTQALMNVGVEPTLAKVLAGA